MVAPAPRKLKNLSHKCFGLHSRIVDAEAVADGTARGRRVGDKQIAPGCYGRKGHSGPCDFRTRAEKRNADERRTDNDQL